LTRRRRRRREILLLSSSRHFLLPQVPIQLISKVGNKNRSFEANFATTGPITFAVMSKVRDTLILKIHCRKHFTWYHSIPLPGKYYRDPEEPDALHVFLGNFVLLALQACEL